jgi:16S rRNA G966 N2-methylase RsmD
MLQASTVVPFGQPGALIAAIDPEFKSLIPPLSEEEFAQLEANIVEAGRATDPLKTWRGVLLDGHNRLEICTRLGLPYSTDEVDGIETRADAKIWIIRNQFGRRNLTLFVRSELALELEPLYAEQAAARKSAAATASNIARANPEMQNSACPAKPIVTRQEVAKVAGVSHDTIAKVKALQKAPDAVKAKLRAGETSINSEYRELVRVEKEAERKKRLEEAGAALPARTERYEILHCGVADLSIPDESVDCIITDPPYPREYLHVYAELSKTAARVLKPGGSCFVMAGQSYLFEVGAALSEHLKYYWTLTYLTPGGQSARLWQRRVMTFWKPVLWFVKGDYKGGWIGDVAKSEFKDNDKRFHHWGQSESGMADLVQRCSEPGQVILDPFVGGGTTGVVALDLNRRFIGCDVDAACVKRTLARLAEPDSGTQAIAKAA